MEALGRCCCSGEDGSIIFRCKECGRSFPQMDHARRHASMHRGTWACAKCQRTFPKRQMLLEHKCGQVSWGSRWRGGNQEPVGEGGRMGGGWGDYCTFTVARKRSQSICRKCKRQGAAKHACTSRMWLCMK